MAQPAAPDQPPAGRPDPWWTRWLAAGTFVLGLAAGVLLVGLLGQDPPSPAAAQGAVASGAAVPPAGPTGPARGVEVSPACLRALNAAQDIAVAVEDVGAAAAALDAAQLDEVIRRLQPLQERLEQDTAACEATGSVPTGPVPTGPVPTGPVPTGPEPTEPEPTEPEPTEPEPTAPASPTG